MRVTHATKLIGKVVRFDNGEQIILVSGGVGNGTTWTFKRTDDSNEWIEMPMEESLPYVLELMKDMIG